MSAQSKEEHVHHVFEKIYNKYDVMNSVISFQRHKAWRNDVMEHMYIKSGSTALDVCCGTGDWALSMAQAVGKKGAVTGLDFSQNMLWVAEEKKSAETSKAKEGMGSLSFVHGNAMDLPYSDNTFDYVTIGFGLRNVPDYDTVLKEMYRVLKPGGKAVCLETSQPNLIGFRQMYFAYFRFIMPVLGKLFAKSYQEYAWLHQSARNFPDKKTLKKMFLNAGFDDVLVKSYTGGVAAMHMAFKQ